MAQSLFMRLKQNYPDCQVSVMAPQWTKPLLDRMPQVDHSIDSPWRHGELTLRARRALGKSLKARNFTSAIVLPNSFKSALIPFHAGIPRRIGWRGEFRKLLLTDCRKLDKQKYPLMVERFVALAEPAGADPAREYSRPRLSTDPLRVDEALHKFGLNTDSRIIALCPGAEFGAAKQWPVAHYASLGNELIARGWQVWMFGSGNDRATAQAILNNIDQHKQDQCRDLSGQTSLAEAIDLMSTAAAVVSNDSGLMHIAAALGRPVAAIYGSSSPEFTPPLTDRVESLTTDIACRPCFKRDCPYGHLRCLTELHPQRVLKAVNKLLESNPN